MVRRLPRRVSAAAVAGAVVSAGAALITALSSHSITVASIPWAFQHAGEVA